MSEKIDFQKYDSKPTKINNELVDFFQLSHKKLLINTTFIKKNSIETDDSFFSIGLTKEYEFYDFGNSIKASFNPAFYHGF